MMDSTPSDENLFDILASIIKKRVSGFSVKYKNESRWQKFIGFLAFFCPKYMTSFTSTFGETVYFPSKEYVEDNKVRAFKILAHEYVHILDRRNRKWIFEILYALPQLLFLLSLGAFSSFVFGFYGLIWLVFTLALLPFPSYGRMALESRGYAMSIAVNIWRHGSVKEETKDWISEKFTGWSYYKMWPFKKAVRDMLDEHERLIYNIDAIRSDGSILEESEAFVDVYEILTGIDLGK